MSAAPTSTSLEGDDAIHLAGTYDTLIDVGADMVLSDADSADFAGGTLRIQIGNARTNEDNLVRFIGGTRYAFNPGQTTPIGTVTVGEDADVVIALSAAATPASVQAFLRQLYYFNPAGDYPTPGVRPITITLTDGDGGTLVIESTVTVASINRAPEGADVVRTTGLYDHYAFTADDFGFVDRDLDAFAALIFAELPAWGGIWVDPDGDGGYEPAAVGEAYDVALLDGRLIWVPGPEPVHGATASFVFQVRDDGGTFEGGEDTSSGNLFTFELSEEAPDAPPAIFNLEGDLAFYREGQTQVFLDERGDAVVSDDQPDLGGYGLVVTIEEGYSEGDELRLSRGVRLSDGYSEGSLVRVDGIVIGMLTTAWPDRIGLALNSAATPELVSALIQSFAFTSSSDDPARSSSGRLISIFLGDGQGNDVEVRTVVSIHAVDDAPIARTDNAATDEVHAVAIAILANDSDVDGPALRIAEIDGVAVSAGQTVTSASGARVTVDAGGGLVYDPNGAFDYLAAASSGAANSWQMDSFAYRLAGATSSAFVHVRVEGLASPGDVFEGNVGDDRVTSGGQRDFFWLQQGGDDSASGMGGVDSFYFGAAFDAADRVDGGADRDSILLQGNYVLSFGTSEVSYIAGIEAISLISGLNETYGDHAASLYSYDLTLVDANVAAGALMKVNGFHLQPGEDFRFDASAESDAPLQVFGGRGADALTGGQLGDSFIFGHDGRFGPGDRVDGQNGYDLVYLRGDYAIDFNDAGYAGSLTGVESIALLTSANNEFAGGGDGEFDYAIVWNDAMLAEGATLTVNGSRLQAHETFTFDGSREADGNLRVFGGAAADTLATGGGADQLHGGGGADLLTGGGGADLFRYSAVGDSAPGAPDLIRGFVAGEDRIDFNRLDARAGTADNEAFAFVGEAAFTAAGPDAPGELRAFRTAGGAWQVEADVDGDGAADLVLIVEVEAGAPLGASDFVL